MTQMFLAVEDRLSEAVGHRLIEACFPRPVAITSMVCHGQGNLRNKTTNCVQIANRELVLVLTDLDQVGCPLTLLQSWAGLRAAGPRLVFRIAVRETEAWLLADRDSFASFLGVQPGIVPREVEAIDDPKAALVQLARRGRRREIRDAIVPGPGVRAKVGLGYNEALISFVANDWDISAASRNSRSLDRARGRLTEAVSRIAGG